MVKNKNCLKILLSLLFIVLTIEITQASSSIFGGRGLIQVEDALCEEVGVASFSSHLLTYRKSQDVYYSDLIIPNISYTPSRYAEIFFGTGRILRSEVDVVEFWKGSIHSNLHDRTIGCKASLPKLPVFKLGVKLSYAWARRLTEGSVIAVKKGFNWSGLLSLRLNELHGSAPNLILNYGENPNLKNYSAGLEFPGSGATFFIEATSNNPKDISNIFDNLTITPGLKINIATYSSFAGGVILDVRKNPNIPNYTVILGLNIGGIFFKLPSPQYGFLTGTVTDAQTGASLQARLTFPEKPKLKPIQSNVQNGVFKAEKIPPGIQKIEINCQGYENLTITILVEANKVNAYDFKLKPLVIDVEEKKETKD